jgi:3'(2'), 5'-bisphosphate nucleotidase
VQRAALATKIFLEELRPTRAQANVPIGQVKHAENGGGSSGGRVSLAKADSSPVTVADLAAQALLISAIHTAFPDDLIIGEEDATVLRKDKDLAKRVWDLVEKTCLEDPAASKSLGKPENQKDMLRLIDLGGGNKVTTGKRFWCLDPIDGTSAFMKGGQYAISLSLLKGGKELLGVLGCPNWKYEDAMAGTLEESNLDSNGLGLMLAAERGKGATVRPIKRGGVLGTASRLDRSKKRPVSDLKMVHFVDSKNSPATLTKKVADLADLMGNASYDDSTQLYSSHMRYAAVAMGGRGYVQFRWPKSGKKPWSIWDHAGSQLIYTESGAGVVTDIFGNGVDFESGNKIEKSWGLITADKDIHARILKDVKGKMRPVRN